MAKSSNGHRRRSGDRRSYCTPAVVQDGFAVAVADLNFEGAQKLADELNADGGEAVAVKLMFPDSSAVDARLMK